MPDPNGSAEQSANAIIAEALKNAGVPPREIQLPPEEPPKSLTEQQLPMPLDKRLDGKLKGQIVGGDEEDEQKPKSSEETAEGGEPPKPTAEKPLSKEEVVELLNQSNSRLQSLMDKKINQLNSNMVNTINALNQFFQTQDTASLENLPENEQVLKRIERLEKGGKMPRIQIQQPIADQSQNFVQFLVGIVDAVGLKADDKRIDWAPDVNDAQTGYNRFIGSIKKALVEDQTNAIKSLRTEGEREISKIRKKTGVDKISNTGPGGAGMPNVDKMTPFQKLEYAFQQESIDRKT